MDLEGIADRWHATIENETYPLRSHKAAKDLLLITKELGALIDFAQDDEGQISEALGRVIGDLFCFAKATGIDVEQSILAALEEIE